MTLKDKLNSGRFVTLVELQPPKGNDLSQVLRSADLLKGWVDAITVPDLPQAILRLGSLPVCSLLQAKGLEAIFSLSCHHRNRLALQSELLNASALGVKTILLVQGEPPSVGDHFDAQAVSDLDVLGLLRAAKRLQEGYDLSGNDLQGKPEFLVGTEIQGITRGQGDGEAYSDLEERIAQGANFFITPSIYDPRLYERFVQEAASVKIPIIVSITLLKSAGMARYINQHIEGGSVPEALVDGLVKAGDKKQKSLEIAADLIRNLRPLCQGIRIIPIGWEELVPVLLDHVGT